MPVQTDSNGRVKKIDVDEELMTIGPLVECLRVNAIPLQTLDEVLRLIRERLRAVTERKVQQDGLMVYNELRALAAAAIYAAACVKANEDM